MDQLCEELLEIQPGDAQQLTSKNGETLRIVQQRSGAQVSLDRTCTPPLIRVSGTGAQVKKAMCMLRAMVAFSQAATPAERGACRWFSAGFCRYGGDADCCQEGVHSAKEAQEAEAAWLARAPLPGTEKVEGRPLLLSLTCDWPMPKEAVERDEEVVELALVAVCSQTGREAGRFHRFVQPSRWQEEDEQLRQEWPAACFNEESTAVPFTDALADLLDWIPGILGVPLDSVQKEDLLFVTCRDWDVQTVMPRQCNCERGTVDPALQDFLLCRWACLKDVFRSHFSLSNEAAPTNLRAMLRQLGLPYVDHGHRNPCMEDSANVGQVLHELICKGWQAAPTAWRETASSPTKFLLRGRLSDAGRGVPPYKRSRVDPHGARDDPRAAAFGRPQDNPAWMLGPPIPAMGMSSTIGVPPAPPPPPVEPRLLPDSGPLGFVPGAQAKAAAAGTRRVSFSTGQVLVAPGASTKASASLPPTRLNPVVIA